MAIRVWKIYDEYENELNKEITLNEVCDTDIIIYDEEIRELVCTEINEGSHDDYIEYYKNPLEFYLSNVKDDNYLEYLKTTLDDRGIENKEDILIDIQKEVIRVITEEYKNGMI